MRKQYEHLFDKELLNLESDIVWKKTDTDELKNKLITDLDKMVFKTRIHKLLTVTGRRSRTAIIAGIIFILVSQYNYKENLIPLSIFNGPSSSEMNTQDGDVFVNFSQEDQELIEIANGENKLFLTKEASIKHNLNEIVPSIVKAPPKIIATKENGYVLVSATYPMEEGKSVLVQSSINYQGSSKLAYDLLIKENPNSKFVAIGDSQALLTKTKGSKKQELILISQNFIYKISGEINRDYLINISKTIKFNNDIEKNLTQQVDHDENVMHIPSDLNKNVIDLKGEPSVTTEQRPGGKLFITNYYTEKGEILVSQGVNSHLDKQGMLNEVRSWYPKENMKELFISGFPAILDEKERSLHIITEEHIYTVAGTEDGEYLIKIAKLIEFK